MIDLSKIVKRFELIKNLISLEEEETISEQVTKLNQLKSDDSILVIVKLLKQKNFGKKYR